MWFAVPDSLAAIIAILLAFFFLASMYVWGKSVFELEYTDPKFIKQRIISAGCSSLLILMLMLIWPQSDDLLTQEELSVGMSRLEWLGFGSTTGTLFATVVVLLLNCIWFAGPIYHAIQTKDWPAYPFYSLDFVRTVIAAPITEELVFRTSLVPILLCGGWSIVEVTFVAPLLFGICHYHHIIRVIPQGYAAIPPMFASCSAQLVYTWIFGIYATFVYTRTGSTPAVILAHMFCNFMGLPKIGPLLQDRKLLAVHVIGLLAFLLLLYPLTSPALFNSPYSIFW